MVKTEYTLHVFSDRYSIFSRDTGDVSPEHHRRDYHSAIMHRVLQQCGLRSSVFICPENPSVASCSDVLMRSHVMMGVMEIRLNGDDSRG